jgi:hypothetical protein
MAAARFWAAFTAAALAQRDERVLTVRYEDLVARPAPTLRAVLAHVGEPMDARCLRRFGEGLDLLDVEADDGAPRPPVRPRPPARRRLDAATLAGIEPILAGGLEALGYR